MIMIKGWEVNTLEAKRFSQVGEKIANIRIDHNSTVTSMAVVALGDIAIDFRFTANYTGLGFIKIDGRIIVADDASVPDVIVKEWKKTGNMPPVFPQRRCFHPEN